MSGPGIAAAVILGPVGLFLAVAIVLRIRERCRHRYSVSELTGLSRTDIPEWPHVKDGPVEGEQAPGGER